MLRMVRLSIFSVLSFVPVSQAQQPKAVDPAPVPAQIISAKRVFISNAGGDSNPGTAGIFSGGPDRSYNQFYAAMKSWGRYELAASPADADLAFEIRFTNPVTIDERLPQFDPQLGLVILDPKTHVILWTFTERIKQQIALHKTRDRNFDQAMAAIVDDVKNLVARPSAVADNAKR